MTELLSSMAARLPLPWIKAVSALQWRHPILKRAFDYAADRFRRKDAIIRRGPGRGLLFNAGGSNAGYALGTSEPLVQDALARLLKPGMTFYDVGANAGFFSVLAARLVGPRGRVVCFEPRPTAAALIRHNAALNGFANVLILPCALAADDRPDTPFFTSENPGWGRLAACGRPPLCADEIRVGQRSLDSLIAELALPGPDVVKIDVEGGEKAVLDGAAAAIRENRPALLIELHGTNRAVAEALERLSYAGFALQDGSGPESASKDAHLLAKPR